MDRTHIKVTDEILQDLTLNLGKRNSPKNSQVKVGWDNDDETKRLFEGGKPQENG